MSVPFGVLPGDIDPQSQNIQIFMGPQPTTNLGWIPWKRPSRASMLNIFCLGGGGGGGGGFAAAAGAARGGGGGGGSSPCTRVTIPLALIPDVLYIQVGTGGVGKRSGGGAAGAGVLSYVSIYPDSQAFNLLAVSGAAGATGGGTGTGAAVGAAGVGGTVATLALMPLGFALGTVELSAAGQVGFAGGAVAGAVGAAGSFAQTGICTMGGTGGGGTTSADFAGGLITAITNSVISDLRPQNATAGSITGSSGFFMRHPFFWSYCGTGGGSSNTGVGGNGGTGGPGSGGGGGGGGIAGAGIDGQGGDGGPGLVILTCW